MKIDPVAKCLNDRDDPRHQFTPHDRREITDEGAESRAAELPQEPAIVLDLALGLSYWLIDVKKQRRWAKFFVIVGMNPIFIYLFQETGGARWLDRLVRPFSMGFLGWMGETPAQLLTSVGAWALMWLMCYWLYKNRILIKI